MHKIDLNEKEFELLKAYYEKEYEHLTIQKKKISTLLKKMKGAKEINANEAVLPIDDNSQDKPKKKNRKRTRINTAKNEKVNRIKKAGAKLGQEANSLKTQKSTVLQNKKRNDLDNLNRYQFIKEALQDKKELMSADDFVVIVMKDYQFNLKDINTLKDALNKTLRSMVNKQNSLGRIYVAEKKCDFYGLNDWFIGKDKIRHQYLAKLNKQLHFPIKQDMNNSSEVNGNGKSKDSFASSEQY